MTSAQALLRGLADSDALAAYTFRLLRRDAMLAWYRGHHRSAPGSIVMATAASDDAVADAAIYLHNEFELRTRMAPQWAIIPVASIWRHRAAALLYKDELGSPHEGKAANIDNFLALAIGMTSAIRAAHEAGLVHRDVKPGNFIFDPAGRCRLTGFGIAYIAALGTPAVGVSKVIRGTPAYMSPEHTGRTRCALDARSDLYSLGVTLFQLLTGRLPFEIAETALAGEWIHAHLASEPTPPDQIAPGVPPGLSQLVLKLLAKYPDQRYQSAAGLESDLKRCRLAWQERGAIAPFALGLRDRVAALAFSDYLYGRDAALATMAAAFAHVRDGGTPALAVIAGPSGVGKSALLHAFVALPQLRGAAVAFTKVDQCGRAAPYAALAAALRRLVLCLLGQSEAEVQYWRQRIQLGLGEDLAPAFRQVPELSLLMDEPAPTGAGLEGEGRPADIVDRLLRIFACPERPLVLIIDDAQWLDSGAMGLLENLGVMQAHLPVLLVLAARTETPGVDSAPNMLAQLRRRARRTYEVTLELLDRSTLEAWLAETLSSGRRHVAGLAALVHQKTAGNPYFVQQFIKLVADAGLMVRVRGSGRLRFDLAQVAALHCTDNVANVLVLRLGRLPPRTRLLLGGLAGLGRMAGIGMLCSLYGIGASEAAELLAPALEAEVLAPADGGYAFTHGWLHDAAYAGLSDEAREQLHLAAGKLLARLADSDGPNDILFHAVGHLEQVTHLLAGPFEQLHYSGVALLAARTARTSGIHDAALRYLATARAMLAAIPDEAARRAFEVDLEEARCEFSNGNLEAAASLVDRLLAGDGERLAKAEVHLLAIEIHVRRGDYRAAGATGRAALRQFGIDLAAQPTDADCSSAYVALRARLDGDWRAMLRDLPPLSNPEVKVSLALLAELLVPARLTDTRLHFLQLCQMLALTFEHGIAGESTVALAWFGVMTAQRHGAYADGFEYGVMARALLAQHGFAAHEARVLLAFEQLSVWTQPPEFASECAQAGFGVALASGDTTTACLSWVHRICTLLARGEHLDKVAQEIDCGLAYAKQARFRDIQHILLVQQQFVDRLRLLPKPGEGGAATDVVRWPGHSGEGGEPMPTLCCWRWIYRGIIAYLEADLSGAESCLRRAGELAWSAPGHIHQFTYRMFDLLTLCGTGETPYHGRIAGHAVQIDQWAALNPATFSGSNALAQAALRERDGDQLAAMRLYEQAIDASLRNGYEHYAALAHELAASLCRRAGLGTAAQGHLRGARDAYRRWGASAKVARLERDEPALDDDAPGARQGAVAIVETDTIRDIGSVIRSARALSEEIKLERLVQTLMQIALDHSSAQRGLLIRLRAGEPVVEACALTRQDGIAVALIQNAVGSEDLPTTMLQMVMRTRQPISVVDGVRPAPFDADPYLMRYPRCAALCIPMLKQAQLVGMLYVENRLSPQAFTAEHAKVLVLLAAQAAVSLETARLYAELLEENQQRRSIEKALRESKATLLQAEQINRSGSWTWEVGRGVLTCSAGFCRIVGVDPAQPVIAFAAFLERVHPDDRKRVLLQTTDCVAQKVPVRVDYRVVSDDGAVSYISGVGEPMGGDGEVDIYVGTAIDITERRAAEDTLRAAQAELARVARVTTVGQLTASIAHEVNQPLMSISSNAGASLRWLERDPPQIEQVRRGLQDIAAQSQRAGGIIQGLQALTRKSTPIHEPVDLHATIGHILSISRNELERHDVALELSLQAASGWVMGDAVQLQQVLLNIVINAIEAMNEATHEVRTLAISSRSDGCGQINIRIDDSGMGLDAAMAGHIFEAFYSTKDKGMGMGLAICRSIIEAHGGSVRAQPRVPHGCRLVFSLPEAPAPGAE